METTLLPSGQPFTTPHAPFLLHAPSHRALLKDAVHQHPLLSRKGLWERLFTLWFDGFVYNQIWEDPEVDLAALELNAESRVLTIASGGCNALNYLVADPERIFAVDLNPCHIHLTRLKLAALRGLPDYESFFQFFGCAGNERNLERYRTHIKPFLERESRRFWEGRPWFGQGPVGGRIRYFASNLYDHARLGCFLRWIHRLARWMGRDPSRILCARNRAEQEQAFDVNIAPFFDHWLVQRIGRLPCVVYSLGIPPRQHDALRRDTGGDVVRLYRERVRKLICDFPLEDNYFAWQALDRRYDTLHRRAIPNYLRAAHYPVLRERASRVVTSVSSVTRFLKSCPAGLINRFVLLDAQDWMRPAELTELWREIARVSPAGGRIAFRTGAAGSPVETEVPAEIRGQFTYFAERSRVLHERDRSAIYGGFHVYAKRG